MAYMGLVCPSPSGLHFKQKKLYFELQGNDVAPSEDQLGNISFQVNLIKS